MILLRLVLDTNIIVSAALRPDGAIFIQSEAIYSFWPIVEDVTVAGHERGG
jgi:hypothetical protein